MNKLRLSLFALCTASCIAAALAAALPPSALPAQGAMMDDEITEFILGGPVRLDADWGSSFLRWADLNGDGRLDFLNVNNLKSIIETYQQTGNEELPFEKKKWYIERNATDMVVVDLNHDERPDIVLAGKPCQVIYQDEEGAFENASDLDFDAQYLLIFDLNEDQIPDLIAVNQAKVVLAVCEKDSSTARFKTTELPSGHKLSNMRPFLSDFNGDGQQDLAYVSASNSDLLVVRYRNEQQSFNLERTYKVGFNDAMAGFSLNEEAALLAALDRSMEIAKVLTMRPKTAEEQKDFFFDDMQVIPFESGVVSAEESFLIADLNQDQRAELYQFASDEAQLKRFQIDAQGAAQFDKFPCFTGITKARVIDIGSAGQQALAFVTPQEEALGLITAAASAAGGESPGLSAPKAIDPGAKPLVFDTGDMDGDGLTDLVIGVKVESKDGDESKDEIIFRYLRGAADGEFDSTHPVTLKLEGGKSIEDDPSDLTVADVNQDGRADLVVFYPFDSLQIFTYDAASNEYQAALRDSGLKLGLFNQIRPQHFRLLDYDGDGKREIVLLQKNYARVLSFDAKGEISLVAQFNGKDVRSNLSGVLLEDLDNDGEKDFVLLDQGNNCLTYYRPENPGEIVRSVTLAESACLDLKTGDLNGDGKNDLIVEAHSRIGLLLRDVQPIGIDVLARRSTEVEEGRYSRLQCADFNGDGQDEIILYERTDNLLEFYQYDKPNRWRRFFQFVVYQGEGPSLGGLPLNSELFQPRQIEVMDYNGDGKKDLVLLIHDKVILYPQK